MTIKNDIIKNISNKKIHFSLIDPDKQSPKVAGSLAKISEDSGSTAIISLSNLKEKESREYVEGK